MSQLIRKTIRKMMSSAPVPRKLPENKMSAWQLHSYGDLTELQLDQIRLPHIKKPGQVLIRVKAASVNPLDVAMTGGYGSALLNLMRTMDNVEFPLTLGRDFCGEVISKGLGNHSHIKVGSTVWGVVPVHQQGSHAEYVIVDSDKIGPKPTNIDTHEASSVLYTGLTAWSGLCYSANLNLNNVRQLKALVLGASGGVGNAAVQLLRAGGADVCATCSTDALPLIESLGANKVIDYNSPQYEQDLLESGRFDLVLDCAGLGPEYAKNIPTKFRRYVTFTTPMLKNFDQHGYVCGTIKSIQNLICPNVDAIKNGRLVYWAYFVPSADGIAHIHRLIEAKKFVPVVEKVYGFKDLPQAYQRVKDGHLRGKIVVDVEN